MVKQLLTPRRIWHNYRRKNTDGLPGTMLILWSICTYTGHYAAQIADMSQVESHSVSTQSYRYDLSHLIAEHN
jgi:hypothetical protein